MALNDSEDASSSSMVASDSDDVKGSNGSALTTKPKRTRTRSGTWFWALSFQVTLKADLSQGASTQDKARLLKEHLSNSIAHSIKTSFTSISTFCYESQLSGQPDSNGLVSILIRRIDSASVNHIYSFHHVSIMSPSSRAYLSPQLRVSPRAYLSPGVPLSVRMMGKLPLDLPKT
jgi:hypothetical protein